MALKLEEGRLILKEAVTIEEAEEMFGILIETGGKLTVNFSECEHIHTAVLQLLLLFREKIMFEEIERLNVNF